MSEQESNQKLTLPFGDVIKRVAFTMYTQLQNVLHNMRIQSPELRTQSLIAFISRSKKKLAQLLAITRWLDMPGIAQFFANMSQLQINIAARENRLNENQDALYFTHSQLFCCRIRSLDVVSAKDILARGTYPHLPASMFSCGIAPDSNSQNDYLNENSLQKSLNIYLRSKLALRDPVPTDIDHSSIEHGLLLIRVNNMYELTLTLDYLSTDAPWNILNFKICVMSHPRESFFSRQKLTGVENDVLLVLRNAAASCTAPSSVTDLDLAASAMVSEDQVANRMDIISSNHEDNIQQETSAIDLNTTTPSIAPIPTKPAVCTAVLPRIHVICQHSAYAAALRYLYIQALETSRTVLMGIGEAEFQEKLNCSQFVFRFWRSRMTGYFQYELRVIQLRSPNQVYTPLDIETVMVDSYGKEIGSDVGLAADSRDINRETNESTIQESGSSSSSINAPKLRVELWSLSAPDDTLGASRITRRRVTRKPEVTSSILKHDRFVSTDQLVRTSILDPQSDDTDNNDSNRRKDVIEKEKEAETDSLFDITEFITDGVSFGGMLHKILIICAENRLTVLHHRLLKTPGILGSFSKIQSPFSLRLESTRLVAAVGEAQLVIYVDSLNGTFSVGSSLLDGVTKGASRDCALFLSEINNVESEELCGNIHTATTAIIAPIIPSNIESNSYYSANSGNSGSSGYSPRYDSSSTASAGSSSASATTTSESYMEVANNESNESISSASTFLRPLSTASGMVQYLAAAHWVGMMKHVISVPNDELHAMSLYIAAYKLSTDETILNKDKKDRKENEGESTTPPRVIPLIYELCTWNVSSSHYPDDANDHNQLRQHLSSTSFDNISSSISARIDSDPTRPQDLNECLTDLSKRVRENSENTYNNFSSSQHHRNDRKVISSYELPTQLSLVFCIAIDEDLNPHYYSMICTRKAGSTLFLAPKIMTVQSMNPGPFRSENYGNNVVENSVNSAILKRIIAGLENAIASSLLFARASVYSTAKLSAFGLYVTRTVSGPIVSTIKPKALVAQGAVEVEVPVRNRCTIVLWCDAGCLIAIQFGDNSGNNGDDNALQLSLLCPIPLPGVGTLGLSGPPTCTVGIPRNVTSEEVDRVKRRCISIGEVALTIIGEPEGNDDDTMENPKKKIKREIPTSYSFCCGELSHLEAFTVASRLSPTALYSALSRELLQHTFRRYHFSPLDIAREKSSPFSLSLNTSVEERNNVLFCLSSAYSSVRPLLEFMLLASSYAAISDLPGGSSGVMNTCKGVLKILSLDCVSRAEPFIVCALYENTGTSKSSNNRKKTDDDDSDNNSEEEDSSENSSVKTSKQVLIGFIEVEIMRSAMELVPVPDTPRTPRTPGENVRSDSVVDEPSGKIEKVFLNVSSLLSNFDDQTVEMEVYRECFQKKLQAMSGRNPFHAFINKLISFFAVKKP